MSLDDQRLETWSGHVIVCGLHDEGLRIVEQLHATDAQVLVIGERPDPALVAALEALGVPCFDADARLPETLTAAGAQRAAAVVCVESDDLHTLAIALAAHGLRSSVRVVVQVHNAAVGRALASIDAAVLDVASLAASSIVEACLSTGLRPLRLGADDFAIAETTALRPGTLRELYGSLAPIALVPAVGPTVISPGRDTVVAEGDTIIVVGQPSEVAGAGIAERMRQRIQPAFAGARGARPTRQRRSLVRDIFASADRAVRIALVALVVLVATSVTVLRLGFHDGRGHMSVLDALYFTVETIGTVGYGDFYFRNQPDWLRIWAICLMIVGAMLATLFFAFLTNSLVSRRLAESLGRRRITGLDGHVVVVGAGSIGVAVVDGLLERGADVVVVDADDTNRFLGHLRRRRVPVLIADATQSQTLRDARLGHARAVAVLTSDDLANIETGLAIRDLLAERSAHVPVVLRLFERRLMRTVAGSFGFRHVRSPAALAAPWFVGAALGLDIIDTFYVGDLPMLVARLTIPAGGLDGLAMTELPSDVRVVSLTRVGGEREYPPRRDTRLHVGDITYLVGPYEQLLHLLRAAAA